MADNADNADNKNQNGGAAEPPIVAISRYRVLPGSIERWNELIGKRSDACRTHKGCTDFEIFRPSDGKKQDEDGKELLTNASFRVVERFDAGENYTDWEESAARKESDALMEPLLQGPVDKQILTGIETFHTASGLATIVAPPRNKISVLNAVAIFPLASLISWVTTLIFGKDLPLVVKSLILTLFLVPLSNYLVMPFITKLAARWLYPSPK